MTKRQSLSFCFAPSRAERRIVLAALGAALVSGALTFGGSTPDLGRWAAITALGGAGLALCLAALGGRGTPRGLPHLAATATLIALAAVSVTVFVNATVNGMTNGQIACRDDTALATAVGGAELRAGQNPYTTYDEVRAWAATCGTLSGSPLRSGVFAAFQSYPTPAQIHAAADAALHNPSGAAIELRPTYPAGALLAGTGGEIGLVLATLAALGAALIAVVRVAARGARIAASLAVLAQTSLWTVLDSGHPDGIAIGLAVLAWIAPSSTVGAALLGGACAIKQTAWFFVLPFVATVWRRAGPRGALRASAAIGLVFAAVNAPFVLLSPSAWAHAVMAPMLDGLFPQGVGLVAIVTAHGFAPGTLATLGLLPVAAIVVASVLAIRFDSRLAGIGAIAGSLALWFGLRSLPQYFIGVGLLAVALVVTASRGSDERAGSQDGLERPSTARVQTRAA